MRGRAWTQNEINLAQQWAASGMSFSEIALALDRSLNAIKEKVYRAYRYTKKERGPPARRDAFKEEKIRETIAQTKAWTDLLAGRKFESVPGERSYAYVEQREGMWL